MKKKLVSIITPVLNEEKNIVPFYEEMVRVTNTISHLYQFEFIFTDNASKDRTYEILAELAEKDKRIRVFSFSKNFGYQKSILTGYCKARGDCAIEFDCDLQDPPSLLAKFLEKWALGFKIIYGIRKSRKENFIITFFRSIFYKVINYISENTLPLDAGDFMLIDRVILDNLKEMKDQHPYLRGIIFGFGYERVGIPYNREKRQGGISKFPFSKLIKLAMDGIISQSTIPLKLASYAGIIIALITLFLSSYYIGLKYFGDNTIPIGFTTTTVLILFSISLNAIFLGIIGEYLARIYKQIKSGHITLINKKIDNTEARFKDKPMEPSLIEEMED